MKVKLQKYYERGDTIVLLLIIIFLFTVMMLPILNILISKAKVLNSTVNKEKAYQIAEAGINYYQWHLAHYPVDYQDGTSQPGPYVHNYTDFDTGNTIGQYSLTITPPSVGSTIVTIQSKGRTSDNPNVTRTITARYGIPSLAQYSFLSNGVIWIGIGETITGQLLSNGGVRFDGVGNAPIQSAKLTYSCPSSQGSPCPSTQNGVWGSASQAVKNFWQFPVPAIDFSAMTSNLASLKSLAQAGGIYLPPSNAQGYSLVFNNDGTVTVYKVTSRTANPAGWDIKGTAHNEYTDYNARTIQYTQAIPTNGVIYVEDNTWVEGTVKGRAMVAAAQLPYNPATAPTIYIPKNLVYSVKDGTDVLGLLAQKDVIVTYHAPNVLEIDGALVAQNGSDQFFYYPNNIKTSISVYGSIMSYGQWTWTWVSQSGNVISGYVQTSDTYDGNLLYGPPPSFPLSASGYQLLSQTSN